MWGFGGRFYWGNSKKQEKDRTNKGIVVVFAWMSSQDKHLKNYVDLYSSFGWDCLVCHSQFLNLFFPDKATMLALDILNELVKELKKRPCPVVFASFSGGPKACMYKALQIIDSKNESHGNQDEYRLVRDCLSGHVFDSYPVDFASDLGTRFVLDPTILRLSRPPKIATLMANGISSSLDALFLTRFESQRAEYWQTLYASVMHSAKSFCNEYERAKTIADNIALEAARQGVPIVVVCPGVMYGPGKITAGNVLARTKRFNQL